MDPEKTAIVYKFAQQVYEKLGILLKAVILFGSAAEEKDKEQSDLDVLLILDDLATDWEMVKPVIEKYLDSLLKKEEFSKIHLNAVTLSFFWRAIIKRDPIAINIIRVGIPIFDSGFFSPLKKLLSTGLLGPTRETILDYANKVEYDYGSYLGYKIKALEFLYWVFTHSAQAAIMLLYNEIPPPKYVPMYLKKMENEKIIPKPYAKWYEEIYSLIKKISHGEITNFDSCLLDKWEKRAKTFAKKMEEIISKNLKKAL